MNNTNELKQAKYLSVSALNRYLSYKFDMDVHLQTVYLEGEISNFKQSGRHFYFSLKDEFSEISAMMFYPNNSYLDFIPCDGMLVQLVGKVGVYEKRGTYSITVKKMIRSGVGLLYKQFLELKDKLEKEGLFDEKFKKTLPTYPKTIGVITSSTGEAINDITSTLKKRFPLVKVVLYPALVQGSDAPKDLIRALKESYANKNIDCLIIGRGGGSFEDLACFNDEGLARCLFQAPFPTISAVGHEGDYTICDFVASLRAPTPTGAAMLAVKNQIDILENISLLEQRVRSGYTSLWQQKNQSYLRLANSYGIAKFDQLLDTKEKKCHLIVEKLKQFSPSHKIEKELNDIDQKVQTMLFRINDKLNTYEYHIKSNVSEMNHLFQNQVEKSTNLLEKDLQKLIILNPLNLMSKGYAVTYQDNCVISSVKTLNKDKPLIVHYQDGQVITTIKEVKDI